MNVSLPRWILAATLSLTAAAGGLLVAGTADAHEVTTGSVSFKGDSGDYISQGKSYSYSTHDGDALDVSSANGSTVSIRINAYNGDWWTLDFDAPGTPDRPVPGKPAVLAPGTYSSAHRYPFNGNGPGLDLSGEGRGCNELTGSFTVTKAVFRPNGYVQTFDATFVQHCEGGTPAARGEVHISNPPPPHQAAPTHTTTTSPRGKTTSPGAKTTSPHATATSEPTATTAADNSATGPDTSAMPAAATNSTNESALLIGAGVIAWFVLIVAGLVTLAIVLAVRRRSLR